jgi:hypothetical protein
MLRGRVVSRVKAFARGDMVDVCVGRLYKYGRSDGGRAGGNATMPGDGCSGRRDSEVGPSQSGRRETGHELNIVSSAWSSVCMIPRVQLLSRRTLKILK